MKGTFAAYPTNDNGTVDPSRRIAGAGRCLAEICPLAAACPGPACEP